MSWLRKSYHFLGSVYFAVSLIGVTALFVVIGTLLESITQSHLYAAFYTYRHPAFLALLALFFVNILFSATRRWPFQKRHIPFLLTHLGLLMILAGTAMKQLYGLQGSMHLLEGSGSHTVTLDETRAIQIKKRDPNNPSKQIVSQQSLSGSQKPFPELELSLSRFLPHCTEQWESWIKGHSCEIVGLQPFSALPWSSSKGSLPLSAKVRFSEESGPVWNIHAVQTEEIATAKKEMEKQERPCLGVFKNAAGDAHLLALYPDGSNWEQIVHGQELGAIFVYDEGFQGYYAFAKLPIDPTRFVTLETPLFPKYLPEPPSKKIEDNRSLISLRIKKGDKEESISLRYDPQGLGLAWPVLEGEYLLRYQPEIRDISTHIRLRQARQINYPGSSQPYSFECDVWIKNLHTGLEEAKTLSMNCVHETPDGYRFYLSNMTPSDESAVKRVRLVVNYDPMKYTLTYPGGLLVSLGILLLWKQSRSSHGKRSG